MKRCFISGIEHSFITSHFLSQFRPELKAEAKLVAAIVKLGGGCWFLTEPIGQIMHAHVHHTLGCRLSFVDSTGCFFLDTPWPY